VGAAWKSVEGGCSSKNKQQGVDGAQKSENGCGLEERRWMELEKTTTRCKWSSKERRGVDGAQKSDEVGCGSKERRGRVRLERATRLGVVRTSDGNEGGWRSNERREWMALERARRVDVA